MGCQPKVVIHSKQPPKGTWPWAIPNRSDGRCNQKWSTRDWNPLENCFPSVNSKTNWQSYPSSQVQIKQRGLCAPKNIGWCKWKNRAFLRHAICKFHHVSSNVGTPEIKVSPKHASGLVHQRGILGHSNFFPTYIINQENDDRMWDFAPDLQNKIHISIYTSQFPKRFSCSSSSKKTVTSRTCQDICKTRARVDGCREIVEALVEKWWPLMTRHSDPFLGRKIPFLAIYKGDVWGFFLFI